jgi:tRNA pseudouridine38-40 synthase
MVEKSIYYTLEHEDFKILGAGRTDRMVSANQYCFELFIYEELELNAFSEKLNKNFPQDIRLQKIRQVDQDFNIIQNSKIKEYIYFFSNEQKAHPFSAPFMVNIQENLDLKKMQEGAKLFQGFHNFKNYCCKPGANTIFDREIVLSEIVPNDIYTANFFPEKSYMFRIQSSGFLRYQVRLMMGILFELGKGEISIDAVKNSLNGTEFSTMRNIAPASGLMLHQIHFEGIDK